MPAPFSLAGLLRLRHLEQDLASAELAAANARRRESGARRDRVRAELGDTNGQPSDAAALHAVAAARASARSMLLELDALEQAHREAVEHAQDALSAARARSIGLEKLAEKHAAAVAAEAIRSEQSVIDELASTSWHRDNADRKA